MLFVAIAIAAHVLLSRLGFSPTDDGFILAQGRRILAGQVPHRDFISIRPVGSALLHTFDLIVGGAHTFLVSRLVYWLETAIVCWCWLEIALRRVAAGPGFWGSASLVPLSFMLSTHAFPPMAWHTVDGVFLATLGFLACQGQTKAWKLAGYLLIGASVTCKQNFLPVLPLAAAANGDLRRPLAWLALAAPAAVYVAVLTALGAGPDMRQQLFALADIAGPGVKRYFGPPGWPAGLIVGGIAGASAMYAARLGPGMKRSLTRWLGYLLPLASVAAIGATLDAVRFLYIDQMCFALLGCLCGLTLACIRLPPVAPIVPANAFLAGLAWCSGISLGYQTPAHVAGPMAIGLLIPAERLLGESGRQRLVSTMLSWMVVLLTAGHWWAARHDHIYNEATAPLLTRRLDGVLPGGDGVVTNPNTFAVLSDLHDVIAGEGGRPYAIVVDVAGWWACCPQANPLPADWPQSIELCTESLQERLSAAALKQRGRVVFIVQKVQMTTLGEGLALLDPGSPYYGAATWIRSNFNKTRQTRFWDVYE